MVFLAAGFRSMSLMAIGAVFAMVASGCVPPDSEQFSKPIASSPAATSEPVVLNGAGGKISGSAAKTAAKSAPPAGEPAVSAVAAVPADAPVTRAFKTDEPAVPASGPVLAAKPLPPKPGIPEFAAAPVDPAATAADEAISKNADGYPNINAPPKEPASALMPADERARVISELEALRKKGGPPAKDSGATRVAKKAGSNKADGKCPDGATAATDPDCKADQ
jgi:hypothetical protein